MTGIDAIAAERRRQIEEEGWTPEHDDQHTNFELARAGTCYAMTAFGMDRDAVMAMWPAPQFGYHWFKPKSIRQDLIRSGALIVAELDRFGRVGWAQAGEGE